ncbi:ATP-binding protein [Spirochaetia bacterium]|nr:ATP-binding protein [Spirochaetia bacterium]GHU29351.1 ATP-binding protein [Spirochaetia bacterium]
MRVIPVASGKGGVGKSLISANLAVALAQSGQRVVLADLDLGASNLHLVIGHHSPKSGIGTFLGNINSDFNEVIAETDIPGLRFIAGDTEIPGTANLRPTQRNALVKQLLALKSNTDVLIIDLGAGTHQSILDFFLLSGQGIVVTSPAVTSVLNAYVFLKNTVFRLMYTIFGKGTAANAYLESIRKEGAQKLYIPRMLPEIKKIDPVSHQKFVEHMDRLHPRIITNIVDDPKEADVAMKIRRSCAEYLSLKVEYLGVIYRDSLQNTSLASRIPITIYKPQAILSQGIYRIADKILQSNDEQFVLTDKEIESSFQETGIEAEIDFESKMNYVEDLLHSGALSQGDLIETIKSQQFEISKLKKENNFIKLKLSKALAQGFNL